MKKVHLTINVPDNKFEQLLEFLRSNFGNVEVTDENTEVLEWQKEEVLYRIQNTLKEDYISWETARKQLGIRI